MAAPAPLLFDLDGTLVDSARTIAAALSSVAIARGGHRITAEAVRPLVSRGVGVVVASALGAFAGDPQADIAEFRSVLAALPAEPGDLYAGVPAALAALQARGHPMAIVTNKPEGLARILLREQRLDGLFGAVIGGDTCTVCKPQPAPLHRALAAIAPDGEAERAIMIGDSDVDGEAAQAAGCRFMLFEGGYGPVSADCYPVDARFSAFDQFDAVLTALTAKSMAGAG
ncbi:phosphoglycolate phosphatase [Novosphingobium sediminis]|uniref:phosphoglycolate phosphatase n=1 Tax=Novosphingobium sediminis TaxID=707214 RepID=A0A512APR1_9SPHN|nr:HAD-IA family hydrolase [Novosphingobium sediminis]GEO01698.1 phosphoglycolate phosphatase [Novosphingobium sediminis]